jgi:hypothetical protein
MEFLRTLLLAPVALSWLLLTLACGALFLVACLIAWVVAFTYAHWAKSWQELLVTTTRVKISWIWGWSAACLLLLAYVSSLVYRERVASWFAALPYLLIALVTLGIAAWLRHSVRTKVVKVQKLVQGGQA